MKRMMSVLSMIILALVMFVGCGDEKLNFDYVKNVAQTSPVPYKIETSIKYSNGALTLESSSLLEIEKEENLYKAKYCYSKQKLNPITESSSEKISTLTGTTYYNGTNIGNLVDEQIEWSAENSFEAFEYSSLDLNADYFEKINISQQNENYVFQGKIIPRCASLLFKLENLEIRDVNFIITYNENISEIKITYINSTNGLVSITIQYDYTNQTVVIPN